MCKSPNARPQCVTFEGNSLISAEWCYACKMPLISHSNESLTVILYPAQCKELYKEKIRVSAFNFIGHRIIPSQTRQMSDLWKICDAFCHKPCHPYTLHCLIKNECVCYSSAAVIQKPFRSKVMLLINNSAIIISSAHLIFWEK